MNMDCFPRRQFLQWSGGAAVLALSGCQLKHQSCKSVKRPNILFIMSDDHASHAISAYGSVVNQTPHIDRIANQGMRFNNCFCTNSLCAPSRAVILTGKYSHLNGVIDNDVPFDGSQQTVPKRLQAEGYQTAIVGKWHLKSAPTGFDYSNILPDQGEYHNPAMIENGRKKKHKGYVTDIITDSSLNWLKNRDPGNPFFLMLHHKAPHADWETDEKHNELYKDQKIPLPVTFDDDYKTRTAQIKTHKLHVGPKQWELHFQRLGKIPEGMSEQQTREWVYQVYMKHYLRCIASVDDNVGRVLNYLDEAGLTDNTVVIYTSDQGFFLGDHGIYDKRFMYEESLRMPFLIRYPEEIEAGTVNNDMILNLDFSPTFLDYAGAPISNDMQGRSFRRLACGETVSDWRKEMYYRFYEKGFGIDAQEGIRTQLYKLIHYLYGDKGWELFDLETDPHEMNNLYTVPAYNTLADSLLVKMKELKNKYALPN